MKSPNKSPEIRMALASATVIRVLAWLHGQPVEGMAVEFRLSLFGDGLVRLSCEDLAALLRLDRHTPVNTVKGAFSLVSEKLNLLFRWRFSDVCVLKTVYSGKYFHLTVQRVGEVEKNTRTAPLLPVDYDLLGETGRDAFRILGAAVTATRPPGGGDTVTAIVSKEGVRQMRNRIQWSGFLKLMQRWHHDEPLLIRPADASWDGWHECRLIEDIVQGNDKDIVRVVLTGEMAQALLYSNEQNHI